MRQGGKKEVKMETYLREEPAEKVVGKAKVGKPSPKKKVLRQKRNSKKRRQSTSSSSDSEEI